jgi:chemotaxis family two-component system response regulator Rcp1
MLKREEQLMIQLEPLTILLVEDDRADQKLIQKSLEDQKIANDLEIVNGGEEGLEFLDECILHSDRKLLPDLILLDLNMPGMGGKEFLRRVKNDDRFKMIPVVILTTSDSDKDIIDTYRLQASGYVKKPVTLEEFKLVMKGIKEYWFMLCKRPSMEVSCERS